MKKIFSLAVLMMTVLMMSAQMPQPLPLNPKVRHGVLPSGLNYYLLHNEEPKDRANFYIAQKVGSTLEEPEQLGLAHFLEHMAFNGTKNYPGKDMLNYLQSKGLRFGADINAYTGFDETVYNIDNVNTQDQALMDSVLLVLHDWSGSILLAEDEINAERGVIQEEWRMRDNATNRLYTQMLKNIYAEPQYQQMPIGTMDVVMNFAPQAIRDYYAKWYRPDQQGIIIVGDFDVDDMEKKIQEVMADIQMPANAAERVYPTVSDNQEPVFFSFEDPELQFPMVLLAFKYDKIPFEYRNTDMAYTVEVLRRLAASMINQRLSEAAQNPDCSFGQAGVYYGDFFVSKTKGAFNVNIIPKTGQTQEAINEAMAIVARACKTGFTPSEFERAVAEYKAGVEQMYNQRDKTPNEALATELTRTFIDNEATPGIEMEYQFSQTLDQVPVDFVNQMVAENLTPYNQVVVIAQPQAEGWTLPAKMQVITNLENSLNAEYEAYVDEVVSDPMIAKLPAKGKVKSVKEGQFGTKEFELSNGAKVILKTTDYEPDRVNMVAVRMGGKQTYPVAQAPNLDAVGDVFELAKFGPYDSKQLVKYLAGKKVGLTYTMGDRSNLLEGAAAVKDLPTLMELTYTAFTNLGPDQPAFDALMATAKSMLQNLSKDQRFVFKKLMNEARYSGNPMKMPTTPETLDKINFEETFKMLQATLANPAEYTFIFVGNVDEATLRPLLEQYIASIKGGKSKAAPVVTPIETAEGIVEVAEELPMANPSSIIYQDFNGPMESNVQNVVMLDLAGDILGNIFIRTLREEEGGTYSPSASGQLDAFGGKWNILTYIQTNSEMQQRMMDRARDEFKKLVREGATADDFNKVKGAALNQFDQNVKTNDYWLGNLRMNLMGFNYIDGHREAIADLTLEDFNKFLKTLDSDKDFIQVVLTGVPESK